MLWYLLHSLFARMVHSFGQIIEKHDISRPVVWAMSGNVSLCTALCDGDIRPPNTRCNIRYYKTSWYPFLSVPWSWQEGLIEGFFYAIYANGDGSIRPRPTPQDWYIDIKCDATDQSCSRKIEGSPPTGAIRVTNLLEQCLLRPKANSTVPLTRASAESSIQQYTAESIEQDITAQLAPQFNCGLAGISDESTGIVLQKLLVIAGANPGPIDGYRGTMTNSALTQILGESSQYQSIADAIIALDRFICAK